MRRPTSCHRRHHRAGTHHQDTRPPTKPRPASPLNSSFTGARPTPPRSQRPVRRTLNVRDDRQLCASIYQLALCPRAAVREPPTQSSVNRPRPSCWQHHNTADLLSTESSTQSIWGKGRLFFLYSRVRVRCVHRFAPASSSCRQYRRPVVLAVFTMRSTAFSVNERLAKVASSWAM